MTDAPDNLILQMLGRIDTKVDRLAEIFTTSRCD